MKHAPVMVLFLFCAGMAAAQEGSKRPWEAMDYGPMMTATLESRAAQTNITQKAISIRLGERGGAHVIFDEDLLRYSVGWTGDFIDWKNIEMDGSHRTWAKVTGDEVFGNPPAPGWGKDGSFDDPRTKYKSTDYDPLHWVNRGYGPLPREWGKYKGCYLHGERVILSYMVGDAEILDSPG